jgi:hypothetical protein
MIFVQFSLRPPRLGGAISKYCFTQKPEEPENRGGTSDNFAPGADLGQRK